MMDKNTFENRKRSLIDYLQENSLNLSDYLDQAKKLQSPNDLENLFMDIQKDLGSMDEKHAEVADILNKYSSKKEYKKPEA